MKTEKGVRLKKFRKTSFLFSLSLLIGLSGCGSNDGEKKKTAIDQIVEHRLTLESGEVSSDFGKKEINSKFADIVFVFSRSQGVAANNMTPVTLPTGEDFMVTSKTGCERELKKASDKCYVRVKFLKNKTEGIYTSSMQVGTMVINLLAEVTSPEVLPTNVEVSIAGNTSGSINLGHRQIGKTTTMVLEIVNKNSGVADLTPSVSVPFYIMSSTCSSVEPGKKCFVRLLIKPTSEDQTSGSLSVLGQEVLSIDMAPAEGEAPLPVSNLKIHSIASTVNVMETTRDTTQSLSLLNEPPASFVQVDIRPSQTGSLMSPEEGVSKSGSGVPVFDLTTQSLISFKATSAPSACEIVSVCSVSGLGEGSYVIPSVFEIIENSLLNLGTALTPSPINLNSAIRSTGKFTKVYEFNNSMGHDDSSGDLVEAQGKLYFADIDDNFLNKLQSFDPVTKKVKEISVISDEFGVVKYPRSMGGKIYFGAFDNSILKLHSYDPSGGGTVKVISSVELDFSTGAKPVVANGSIFFPGKLNYRAKAYEFKESNNQVVLVNNLLTEGYSDKISHFANDNGVLYFTWSHPMFGGLDLYKYDPSIPYIYEENVVVSTPLSFLKRISSQNDFGFSILSYGGKVYFTSEDSLGSKLHVYDPATNSISKLSKIREDGSDMVNNLIELKGLIYFTASDNPGNQELFSYNPSTGTISQVSGNQIEIDGDSFKPIVLGGKMYFSAKAEDLRSRIYQYDPQNKFIGQISNIQVSGEKIMEKVAVGGKIYFKIENPESEKRYSIYEYDPNSTSN